MCCVLVFLAPRKLKIPVLTEPFLLKMLKFDFNALVNAAGKLVQGQVGIDTGEVWKNASSYLGIDAALGEDEQQVPGECA